jgi:hypothetical protein
VAVLEACTSLRLFTVAWHQPLPATSSESSISRSPLLAHHPAPSSQISTNADAQHRTPSPRFRTRCCAAHAARRELRVDLGITCASPSSHSRARWYTAREKVDDTVTLACVGLFFFCCRAFLGRIPYSLFLRIAPVFAGCLMKSL